MSSDDENTIPDSQEADHDWHGVELTRTRTLIDTLLTQHGLELSTQSSASQPTPSIRPSVQQQERASAPALVQDLDRRTTHLCTSVFRMLREVPAAAQESLCRRLSVVCMEHLAHALPAFVDPHFKRAQPWRVKKCRKPQAQEESEDEEGDESSTTLTTNKE